MSDYSAAIAMASRVGKEVNYSAINHVMAKIHASRLWAATQGRSFVFMAAHPTEIGCFYNSGYACSFGKNAWWWSPGSCAPTRRQRKT